MNTNTDAIIVFDNVKARIALTYPSVMPEDYKYPDDENQLAMARHILQMRHIAERAITEALTQSKIQDVSLNAHGIQHLAHNLWNKRVMEKLKQWRDAVAESVPAQGSSSGIHNRGVQRLYAELLPCHEEVLVVKFLSKNEGYTRRFLNLIEGTFAEYLLSPKRIVGGVLLPMNALAFSPPGGKALSIPPARPKAAAIRVPDPPSPTRKTRRTTKTRKPRQSKTGQLKQTRRTSQPRRASQAQPGRQLRQVSPIDYEGVI